LYLCTLKNEFSMGRIIWTEIKIREEAKKFKNRTEFWTVHRAGYIMAVRLGILDEIFPIHKGKRIILKRPQKWTLSHLKEVSKKYDYRSDFMKGNTSAYEAARIHDLLDLLFEDKPNKGYKRKIIDRPFEPPKKQGMPFYWTKERIIEEGRKYDTRLELKSSCFIVYQYALKKKCLDEIFKNKPNKGYQKPRIAKGKKSNSASGHRIYWTEERILKMVSTWKGSFKSLCRKYSGLSCSVYRLRLGPKIRAIRSRIYDSVPREQIEAEARKYTSRSEFRSHSPHTYYAARHQNIIDELFPQ
jgi:hypothetical protein